MANSTPVLARPRAGELLLGAVGRSALINGLSGEALINTLVPGGDRKRWQRKALTLFANAFGSGREELLRSHTVTPFINQFRRTPIDSRRTNQTLPHAKAHLNTDRPRFCLDCAREDAQWFGFAFWRTRHQLPGVTVCTNHGKSLVESNVSPHMGCPPAYALSRKGSPRRKKLNPKSLAYRYAQIAQDVWCADTQIEARIVSMRLRAQARLRGLSVRSRDRTPGHPSLDEYAFGLNDPTLESLLPPGRKSASERLSNMLGSNGTGLPVRSAVLAAVLLFDSDEEASANILWPARPDEVAASARSGQNRYLDTAIQISASDTAAQGRPADLRLPISAKTPNKLQID